MFSDNIINDSCFSEEDRQNYNKYREIIGNKLEGTAIQYMNKEITMQEALEIIHNLELQAVHNYTIDLFFVLACTQILKQRYEDAGIHYEIFRFLIKDIKYKLDECLQVKNVFGTFVISWYIVFLEFRRIALGRLQYDITEYSEETVAIGEFMLNKGDFILRCHVPSGGPLKPELCRESFEMAYAFFNDRLKDGILPIVFRSWLLFPDYTNVFGEYSNTVDFARNFKIISVHETEEFDEAWRVFGMDYEGEVSKLPIHTTLQRNFVQYIKEGKAFGGGTGVLLFDGENVLTRR